MGLAQELESLERQRRAEIRTLHQTYLRTKRTVIRTASPSRIVRRHLGVSLAAAAALGMAMAPRPGAAPTPAGAGRSKSKWGFGGLLARLKPVIQHVAPEVANYIPDAKAESEAASMPEHEEVAPRKRSHKILHTAIMELAPLLLSKIDFRALLDQVMHGLMPKEGGGEEEETGNGEHEPHMSVADAGTVKHQDYEDFQ